MGTKRTLSEGAASKSAKLPPKRKVVVRPAAVETATKPKARNTTVPVNTIAPADTPAVPAGTQFAPEIIALRAYFISQQRQVEGRDGDPLSDWLEAERQLLSESRA